MNDEGLRTQKPPRVWRQCLAFAAFWTIRSALAGLGRLERDRALRLARMLVPLFALVNNRRRKAKLHQFFDPLGKTLEECDQINEANLDYLANWAVEMGRRLVRPTSELAQLVSVEGEQCIRSALEKGRGVLVVSAHMGAWWHIPIWLGLRGYPVTAVFKTMTLGHARDYWLRVTNRYGVNLCFLEGGAGLAVRRALERNEVVYLSFDVGMRRKQSVLLPFGHAGMEIDCGPAVLALRQRSPVVQATCALLQNGSQLCFQNVFDGEDERASAESLCARWLEVFYTELCERPGQWWLWSFTKILRPHTAASDVSSAAGARIGAGARAD
jgi:KDO2-lipid IV(A) lauroyltransferase